MTSTKYTKHNLSPIFVCKCILRHQYLRQLTSSVEVESLLPLLFLNGLVQEEDGVIKLLLLEAAEGKVIVSEHELSGGVAIHGQVLLVAALVHGRQIIIHRLHVVLTPPVKSPSENTQHR